MSAEAPLREIVVVELGHNVAAPFAGEILGDLGATVIKVEKPDGDDARRWAPPFWHGHSALFQSLNRNKLSVVVDLRDEADRGRLERLILERADVVIQNLRPGTAAELVPVRELDDLPLVHDRDAVARVLDDAEIVRDEQQRQPELLLQVLKQIEDLSLDRDIEGRHGLVRDHEARPHGERNPPSPIVDLEPREHPRQIRHEQRGINRHIENGGD